MEYKYEENGKHKKSIKVVKEKKKQNQQNCDPKIHTFHSRNQ